MSLDRALSSIFMCGGFRGRGGALGGQQYDRGGNFGGNSKYLALGNQPTTLFVRLYSIEGGKQNKRLAGTQAFFVFSSAIKQLHKLWQ